MCAYLTTMKSLKEPLRGNKAQRQVASAKCDKCILKSTPERQIKTLRLSASNYLG